ncbi:O-acetylhomoserine aminocarboxypropyltransferase/cysteine synthase family protein [Halalkalicoccus subterraneus]|uniref:O-acetylhomoserine aminocarboxypropyltransferase/cysteine synthase family protein n=1 Tax=Halalkalicoccus subterraneus TaxID=2675002 RepID=UPI000EFCEAAF|nr:O-acetylhomoserine aminocarboxypropyltransferase/cysteine synthase family protein [Halalkalicoccus subterraneus]
MNDWGPATRSVHSGGRADPATGARATPIYQTTSYQFESADHAADLYALSAEGDVYSRISNPTTRTLEERLAALEGGVDAVATSSGMAALDAATFLLAAPGDSIVSSSAIYGGTTAYFNHVAGRRGIETHFVDTLDYEEYEKAIDEDTAFVHLETIGNPSLVTPDIERVAEIAHDNGAPLFVDNTFATPYLCRPLECGADLVWESTTKWLHGSGSTVGGALIDGGSFDWTGYEELSGENPAYDGIDFSRDFPEAPFAAAARFRSLRALGAQQAPFDAWATLQGLESFPLRMERHCENAAIVAEFLADHEAVSWVTYPGLESHPTHDNAREYLEGGFGGMIAFGLENGFEGGKRVCEAVDLVSFVANIGDAKSLIIHPASTTHGQLTPEQRAKSGVTEDLVRLSVGIEDPEDVLRDLDRAIEVATGRSSEP